MTRHSIRELAAAAVLTLVIVGPTVVAVRAQAPQNATGGNPDPVSALKAIPLIDMLKATPGVLGVDATLKTLNGKMVIFAWFENKKAALAWYYSAGHQALMTQFSGSQRRASGPMADVPDDGQPILAIASLTMPNPAATGDPRSAITQIAIELYAPLPGGLAAGGRFAPSAVRVQGLIEVPMGGPRRTVDGQ